MFQLLIAGVSSIGSGNQHHPKTPSQSVLGLTHNFPQTAPNTITNNGASNAA
jgi:hypothetical protein